jgi:hypothetical protein
MTTLVRTRLASEQEWQEFSRSCTSPCVFQSSVWVHRMSNCLGGYQVRPFLFEFTDNTRVLWPLLQHSMRRIFRRLEAIPLGLYGNPLIQGEWHPEKGEQILRALLNKSCLELHYFENPLSCGSGLEFGLPSGISHTVKKMETHVLTLQETWEAFWTTRLSSRLRNKVRKAQNAGLQVRRCRNAQEVDQFYEIYVQASRQWGYAQPPYPRKFFHRLLENGPDCWWLSLVVDQSKAVAGAIFVEDEASLLYWFGALDRSSGDRYPMVLLFAHVIQEAIEKNKRYLNLGASGALTGVRQFKELWHAEPVSYRFHLFRRWRVTQSLGKVSRILHAAKHVFEPHLPSKNGSPATYCSLRTAWQRPLGFGEE